MRVVVVGCGRMGSELAYRLCQRGHDVSVVAHPESVCEHMPDDFHGRVYEGDAMNFDVLHRAGIEDCDALVAATSSDSLNLVVSQIAREYFHVPHIVARNYDPMNLDLYDLFGVQNISATSWAAQRLEEMVYHGEVRTVFSAGNGEVEVYEFKISAEWAGKKLAEIMSHEAVAISVTRSGRASLPAADWVLEEGDVVHVSATLNGVEDMRMRVCPPRKVK